MAAAISLDGELEEQQGLAISLIFGIFVSTLLTLLIIPVLYFRLIQRGSAAG